MISTSALLLLAAVVGGRAQAQAAPIPMTLPAREAPPTADTRWALEDLASIRFQGEDLPGPTVEQGDRVEIVLQDGAMTRVKVGSRFGWVPSAKLTDQAPAASAPPVP